MPTNRKLLPGRRPKFQRHAMVPFIGGEAASVATCWFFGLRTIEAQASASGTSTARALQVDVAIGTAAGSEYGTAVPTRILQPPASATAVSSLAGDAIRWNQEASGEAAGSDQTSAHGQGQFLTSGTIPIQADTSASCSRDFFALAVAEGSASVILDRFWIVAVPVYHRQLPSHAPWIQRQVMVPFIGTEAASVATNWFFDVRMVEAQASASGASSATAFQFEIGECTAAGSAATTAGPTRILGASASCTDIPSVSGTAIRWSHVAVGTAVAWGQVFATAIRQPLAGGTIAGRVTSNSAGGLRQRNAIATAAGGTTALCNPWFVAAGTITAAAIASGTPTRLRCSTATGAGRAVANSATSVRVLLLTAETLAGSSTGRVDIWIYAGGTMLCGCTDVLAAPSGTWRAVGVGHGATTLDGISTRLRAVQGLAAGASAATLDPTIRIEGAAIGEATKTGAPIRMAGGAATSAGHATQCAVGRRVQYGRAPAWGAVLIGATGSWVKTAYGYTEGQGEAVAGAPDWRQTARAMSGCGSIMSTVEKFAGRITTTQAESAGRCADSAAIPDSNIVLVDFSEPAKSDGIGSATVVADCIVWPEPILCKQWSEMDGAPETLVQARIVQIETPGCLAGDVQFAVTSADASSFCWALALAASDPIARRAECRADSVATVEYRQPLVLMEPLLVGGFGDSWAHPSSTEAASAWVWNWCGVEAGVTACWQQAEGKSGGDSLVRGLGGFPIRTTARPTRGNSAAWAVAGKAT